MSDASNGGRERLAVGDECVVYVPWQMHDENCEPMRSYWEGAILAVEELGEQEFAKRHGLKGKLYTIERGESEATFHERWVFPKGTRVKLYENGADSFRRIVVQ